MRLEKLQRYVKQRGWKYSYVEEDGLGSLDFEYKGLKYHVWEFLDGEPGAESNVRNAGRQEEYLGAYEEEILGILLTWET